MIIPSKACDDDDFLHLPTEYSFTFVDY